MTKQVNISLMRQQRRLKDLGIEGMAARWYDRSTRRHRMEEMKSYARESAKYVHDGGSVLEIATGPGYLAIELAKLGNYRIVGLDISRDFVNIASRNAREAGVNVDFRQGNVADIPFPDNSFDFIVCTAAFKNFKEPLVALNEMHRVLRPGSTALIIDMDRNASNQKIEDYVRNLGANGFDRLFTELMMKHVLRNGAYTKDELIDLISRTEFNGHEINEEGIGFYVYLVK
jgi:ubiquinone/menaquinone biosynthesis C-methylase UbiE